MLSRNLISEYEKVLIDKKKTISSYFFSENIDQREKLALEIMRYGILKYLRWTPEQAVTNLNYDILQKIKVFDLISYLTYPPEINPKQDLFFIVNKLYPGYGEYNFRDVVTNIYKKVLSGEILRFPKKFFDGLNGEVRACICMQYALGYKMFTSVEEGYKFFSSPAGANFLKKMKIFGILNAQCWTALDLFHKSLGSETQNDFYYNYFLFERALANIKNKKAV